MYGDGSYQEKWPTKFAIASGVLVLLSFLKYVYRPLEYLALAAVVVGIFPIILKGVAALRNRTLDTNILVLIAGNIFNTGSLINCKLLWIEFLI